jgi:hypothetical protein
MGHGQPVRPGRVTPPAYVRCMEETTDTTRQQPLPFDLPADEADHPIAYALTARARRQVAPEALPALRVLAGSGTVTTRRGAPRPSQPQEDDGDLDQPGDTRPSRARALRRAGVGIAAIARQLGTEELIVRAWVGDVTVHPTAVRRDRATAHEADRAQAEDRRRRERLDRVRHEARVDGRARMHRDPSFAAGMGLLAGLVTTDEHALTFTTTALEIAATAQAWLVAHAGVQVSNVRVVLRLGPDVAGDLARRRWSDALRVPPESIVHTRWRGAPSPDAEEALVRVPDPALAARIAGWRDALLEPPPATPADASF